MTNYDPYAQGGPPPPPGQGYPPPPPAHQAPRRKGGCMRMIGIATVACIGLVIVIAVVAIASSGGDDDDDGGTEAGSETTEGPVSNSGNEENPPADDVAITDCGPGIGNPAGGNFAGATGTLTNHSSEASTYLGTVEFLDGAGTRYAESPIVSSAVAPGQTAEFSAPTLSEHRPDTECRVSQIDRFAS